MSSLIKKYEREKFYEICSQITPLLTEEQQQISNIIKEKSIKISLKNTEKNNEKSEKNKINSNSNSNSNWRKVKPSLIPKDIGDDEKLKNNITCLLNKSAPSNFENISKKIADIIDNQYSIIDHCVNEIF